MIEAVVRMYMAFSSTDLINPASYSFKFLPGYPFYLGKLKQSLD